MYIIIVSTMKIINNNIIYSNIIANTEFKIKLDVL